MFRFTYESFPIQLRFILSFQTELITKNCLIMDYRHPYYRPQRQHRQKYRLGKGREENRGPAGFLDLRGRARQKNEREEIKHRFCSSPSSPTFSPKKALVPSLEVDEIKLGAARRKLFETGPGKHEWNKGFRNELKMKMNGKARQMRDFLEPKPKKALRQLNPPPIFFFNAEAELKTKREDCYHHEKVPESFLPNLFSTPFKDHQPRHPWTLQPPPLSKPQPLLFKVPCEKLSLPKEADWRPSQDVTQDKMMMVRQWRKNAQPVAPLDFMAEKKKARAEERREREREVIQPRTPPRDLRLVPGLAVTEDKMARVRQWREKIQQELPRDDRQRRRQPRLEFRQRPELEVTQDKMARVREWRQKITLETERDAWEGEKGHREKKSNQNKPGLFSTLHNLNEMDWLNDNNQFPKPITLLWERREVHRKPRDQRRKTDQKWGDFPEFGGVCKFDKESDETYDFLKDL